MAVFPSCLCAHMPTWCIQRSEEGADSLKLDLQHCDLQHYGVPGTGPGPLQEQQMLPSCSFLVLPFPIEFLSSLVLSLPSSLSLSLFKDRVSLCSPGGPGGHCVVQANLRLRDPPGFSFPS